MKLISDSRFLEELWAVERDCFGDSWTQDMLHSELSGALSLCCTEQRGGKIAAFALGRVVADEGELFQIGTLTEFRGQGIAEGLLRRLHAEMLRRGAKTCFLEVRSKNSAAIALYQKLGYTQIGIRRGYYPDDDAIVMKTELFTD